MLRFLTRRLLGAVITLLIISAVTFMLFYSVPRDPARMACGKLCTPETLELIRHNMGISDPLPQQYWDWLAGIFMGRNYPGFGNCEAPCLGYSFVNREPVLATVLDRFPTTFSLGMGAAVVFVVFGVGMGMLAARHQGKAIDKFASGASLVASSMQIYFVGTLALYFFVYQWQILDQPGYTPFSENPGAWFSGLLLPWLVLALIFTANYTRMTRSQMVETLNEDFVRTARAKGLSRRTVFFRFAWRGAMGPIVTIFGIDMGVLLGGAMITEQTFSLQGIGMLAVKSVFTNDLPMLLGVMVLTASFVVIANILVDACYALIDPRIRLA
ncbi:ABC transporter permease [Streptomyces sp. NPDC003635]